MKSDKKKVVVAMSGGVDSNTTSLLLMKHGYEVIGLTAIMHEAGKEAAVNAAKACETIGIKHETLDLRESFENTVINYFEDSYRKGLTPNPCTFCNKAIKWGEMKDFALKELDADLYATGHYVRIIEHNGAYKLYRAKDLQKDQSYMLYNLTQADLARTIFPLGELTKSEIKDIARKNNITPSEDKESQDVCFITSPETTSSYLTKKFGEKLGDILEYRTGRVLGQHTGAFNYTIGQRKGIKISAPEPLYVISLDPEQNRIYVGSKQDLSAIKFKVKNVNWQQEEFSGREVFRAMVKIRYNSPAQVAEVSITDEKTVMVEYENPKSAITPGQSAVFYDENNEYLIGGGNIDSVTE